MGKKLSFIIPCYRSEGLVGKVITQIEEVVGTKCDYEIITINDSSPDNVLHELLDYAACDPHITVVDLAKNVGKHAALMAGYSMATGDIIVNVDDDGQCPVDRVWDLLMPLEDGYDIAIARYSKKKQSWFKNFGSKVNDLMTCALIGKPKDLILSNFSAMKRFICDEIVKYKNPYPYIDGLFLRSTDRIKNVDMEENERILGTTGFTFAKSLNLWMNGFTAFSVKPLRVATGIGMLCSAIGFIWALGLVISRLFFTDYIAGYISTIVCIIFFSGMIMMMLGIIGEYIGRIYISINNAPQYVIRERVSCAEAEENDKQDAEMEKAL